MNQFTVTPVTTNPTPLQNLATSPQRVRTDEGTVEERPIDQLLQADVYNRLDAPLQNVPLGRYFFGIGIASVRPPDSLGTQNRDGRFAGGTL